MSTPTITSKGNAELAELAYTPTGRDRKGGEAARTELARRVANGSKFAGKYIPVRTTAPEAAPARVTDAQVDDLLARAKRVANKLAGDIAGEVAEPGDIVRTKIRLRKDLLGALADLGAEEFLRTFAG